MLDSNPLFADDGLLPAQFSAARVQASAEQVLWGAVFEQALEDLCGSGRS